MVGSISKLWAVIEVLAITGMVATGIENIQVSIHIPMDHPESFTEYLRVQLRSPLAREGSIITGI